MLLDLSQILLGGMSFTVLSFPLSLSLFHHLPILHLITFSDSVKSMGSLQLRSGDVRDEVIDTCKQYDQGNKD